MPVRRMQCTHEKQATIARPGWPTQHSMCIVDLSEVEPQGPPTMQPGIRTSPMRTAYCWTFGQSEHGPHSMKHTLPGPNYKPSAPPPCRSGLRTSPVRMPYCDAWTSGDRNNANTSACSWLRELSVLTEPPSILIGAGDTSAAARQAVGMSAHGGWRHVAEMVWRQPSVSARSRLGWRHVGERQLSSLARCDLAA